MPPTLVPSPTDATTESLEAVRLEPGHYLAVEAGSERRVVPLREGATHIGRSWTADVVLDDKAVSRRHAIVYISEDSVRILDDRSANGTLVNGRCVSGTDLADGDTIGIGRVVLTYRAVR
jgi:pSer/pThr/pTyr-binding forkhead associated (FHA) protein